MKAIVLAIVILILLHSASAATIYGNIYDLSLERESNAIIEIDTEPNQQFIAKNGTYLLEVPAGEYLLTARSFGGSERANERISVKDEGKYVVDLVLFPEIDTDLTDDLSTIGIEDNYFENKTDYSLPMLAGILLLAVVVYYFARKKKSKPEDDFYGKVLDIIKKEKRVTQKDIRKQVPMSEAKVSLIISELEHKGIVEKVKKGRGNIIILK